MPQRKGTKRQRPPTRGEWVVFGLKMLFVALLIIVPSVFVAATANVGNWWGHHEAKVILEHLPTTTTTAPRR